MRPAARAYGHSHASLMEQNLFEEIIPEKSKLRFLRKHRLSSEKEGNYYPGFLRPPVGKNRSIARSRCKSHIDPHRD